MANETLTDPTSTYEDLGLIIYPNKGANGRLWQNLREQVKSNFPNVKLNKPFIITGLAEVVKKPELEYGLGLELNELTEVYNVPILSRGTSNFDSRDKELRKTGFPSELGKGERTLSISHNGVTRFDRNRNLDLDVGDDNLANSKFTKVNETNAGRMTITNLGFLLCKLIYDNYANRKGIGTLNDLLRLQIFIKKVSKNNHKKVYFLKADIKHYFETINHEILLNIIKKKIKDRKVIFLIKKIIDNVSAKSRYERYLGMPLGNLTSQFFANVYLNEIDYFVKHNLNIKYYLRYVDDFVILHNAKEILESYKGKINNFLKNHLKIGLHEDKSKTMQLKQGINFLGFRNFYYYRILRRNKRKLLRNKLNIIFKEYKEANDYNNLMQKIESMLAHIENGSTFNLRTKIITWTINATN